MPQHLTLFLLDSLFSATVQAMIIVITITYVLTHKIGNIEQIQEIQWLDSFKTFLCCIFVTSILFLVNYWSFALVRSEQKVLQYEERNDSIFNETTSVTQNNPVSDCIVKFISVSTTLQKLCWVLLLNTIIIKCSITLTSVILLKLAECYFLFSFYIVGKLHQGNKKVNFRRKCLCM